MIAELKKTSWLDTFKGVSKLIQGKGARDKETVSVEASSKTTPDRIFTISPSFNAQPTYFNALSGGERQLQDLATGTLNLINLCVEKQIDTIFFLDRSARPAAVLFRQVWQTLLSEFPKPEIRFINMGPSNQDLQEGKWSWARRWRRMHKKLAARYINLNTKGNILVADEYISSGATINRAKSLIKRMYPQANILATGLFLHNPSWYIYTNGLIGLSEDNSSCFKSYFSQKNHASASTILQFRQDLSKLAELIAQHAGTSPRDSLTVKPFDPGHQITTS